MTLILDVPWVVNEEAERISTHGGMASIDFNGAEKEGREAMRLVAQVQEMAKAALQMKQCPDPRSKGGQMARERMDAALRAAGVL